MNADEKENNFLSFWFKGFSDALDSLPEQSRELLFKHCGSSCSDSCTKQIYNEEFSKAASYEDFFTRLKTRFPEIEFKQKDEHTFLLIYSHCACDLVKKAYVTNPSLCECSRQSLICNWESIMNGQPVEIKILQSILKGNDFCMFEIKLPPVTIWSSN